MMLRALLLPALLLAACSFAKPGEDENGIAARARARPVLPALVAYHKDRHEYPRSLYELVPRYLKEVPFDPGLHYDKEAGVIDFAYFPSFPRQDPVNCGARLGDLDWTCQEPE